MIRYKTRVSRRKYGGIRKYIFGKEKVVMNRRFHLQIIIEVNNENGRIYKNSRRYG